MLHPAVHHCDHDHRQPLHNMNPIAYRFENCETIRVIDGDTFIASIDVGFNFTTTQRIRLLGCDMPERNQPGGKLATAELAGYLAAAERLTIQTVKLDSFGRWLATVQSDANDRDATAFMLAWLEAWRQSQ